MKKFPLKAVGIELAATVQASPMRSASQWGVRVIPPGWVRDWGPAVRRTIAVYLSGQGELEASDGQTRRIRPGMVLLAEDTTGPGHRVRVVGNEPVTAIHIIPSD